MTGHGSALFDTALGACGLAWSARGITAIQLPQADRSDTRRALHERAPDADHGGAVTPEAQQAIEGITRLLDGHPAWLSEVVLDLAGVAEFDQRVYAAARRVGPGDTVTYGEIAETLATPGAARAVGQALGRNPCPIVVPCHRVLAASGKLGGFSAYGGRVTKQRLLALEDSTPGLFDL